MTFKYSALAIWTCFLFPSIAFAANWGAFFQGMAEEQVRINERQEQKAIYQADFEAALAELQYEQKIREQSQIKNGDDIKAKLQQDIDNCTKDTITRKNSVKQADCVSNAWVSRYQESGYAHMELVTDLTNSMKTSAKEYAKGKITQDQLYTAIRQYHEKFAAESSVLAKQDAFNNQLILSDLANKKAKVAYINQQQAIKQKKEMEELRQQIDEAKAEARAANLEASDAKQQLYSVQTNRR